MGRQTHTDSLIIRSWLTNRYGYSAPFHSTAPSVDGAQCHHITGNHEALAVGVQISHFPCWFCCPICSHGLLIGTPCSWHCSQQKLTRAQHLNELDLCRPRPWWSAVCSSCSSWFHGVTMAYVAQCSLGQQRMLTTRAGSVQAKMYDVNNHIVYLTFHGAYVHICLYIYTYVHILYI